MDFEGVSDIIASKEGATWDVSSLDTLGSVMVSSCPVSGLENVFLKGHSLNVWGHM